VINRAYDEDERKANSILVRKLKEFGNISCLTFAAESANKHFLAHAVCKDEIENVWLGKTKDEKDSQVIQFKRDINQCYLFRYCKTPLLRFKIHIVSLKILQNKSTAHKVKNIDTKQSNKRNNQTQKTKDETITRNKETQMTGQHEPL